MSDVIDRPRVLVTGAGGAIGSVVAAHLNERWRLRATDLRPSPGVEELDVTDADACRAAFTGLQAVVHLAGNPDPSASWSQLYGPNVAGAYVVTAAARDCAVPRLVLASSQQAVSAYPDFFQRRAADPARPANLYGATKAWAEALGSWVAASSETTVVALRIGYFAEHPPTGKVATPRNMAAWLSHRDCAELIRAAVEADVTGLTVVNGVSANRYRHATLGEAERLLGYRPLDDAWAPRD
ncbi:MAG TPA: NAD(P)-dependent oxidoreductase [Solirubrobacteraceae bacterium]|nr:NAD(P)-dependent oxidoreductase [Solirubrobacteraceae bacterium]